MFGLLNLNKPVGTSSAGVLGRIKRLVRPAKIGHAGTLDPLASGVLVACVGPATRLAEYVQRMPKRYRATFLLGQQSDSDDIERPVTKLSDPPIPSRDQIERAAARFVGEIQQRPPAFSALKIAGRPAYQLARKGRAVELQPRPVTIHRLIIGAYDYPTLTLEIECGSGTYVRALGRDLAESLGTAAVMSALERTAVGEFRVEDACDLNALSAESLPQILLSPLQAVNSLPRVQLSDPEVQLAINGLFVPSNSGSVVSGATGQEFAGIDSSGELVSILRRREDASLAPVLNFRKAAPR
ncbi:MAG TPA: tRNA pseudouridine(55) synthase TruB [Pirellulales bacterium]|jgi:tRNA pseudouridine55 synthase|nr:tRNA pseudouridine(55) synthase TruB [Pirellulales bacterium]